MSSQESNNAYKSHRSMKRYRKDNYYEIEITYYEL